ncbi:single-stranded DNA-binding protein [Methylophilales bacterium MBRSG12]|uniref:Single-stranded DNA-binding protein n=1 Tax=Methylophilales bacterium MBRS-H7 TaxID=1623450 RepID=A0A0H4JBR5_9PROT|nr:single-stranded DNA-binding protein [Methylophilales bacterium MBRSF5]AKO65932.1 single-stranded DNA-binding protein [Methylophilales bacterium MBRS-H7]AKO67252.1 single-stranded DNA-binding protein [Methylophilales bacterium MBRSG12]
MPSVNKVILMGNLGRDPEVRFMPNGDAVCNFSIATTDSWKDKAGERQEKTEWHNIVMYRRLAEIAGEYLKKGRPVYLEGRLQTRKWQTKEGQDRYTTEVIADSMQMLGGRDGAPAQESQTSAQPDTKNEFDQTPPRNNQSGSSHSSSFDEFEDDIPF